MSSELGVRSSQFFKIFICIDVVIFFSKNQSDEDLFPFLSFFFRLSQERSEKVVWTVIGISFMAFIMVFIVILLGFVYLSSKDETTILKENPSKTQYRIRE